MSTLTYLEWIADGPFNITRPVWIQDPDIEALRLIIRQYFKLPAEEAFTVEHLAEGAFNKVYKINLVEGAYVIRVALPVEVPHKMQSEVATMMALSQNTSIPVPRVLAHNPSCDNPLHLPWMLMDFVEGHSLEDRWRHLRSHQKEKLVQQIAMYQSQLSRNRYPAIGSLKVQPSSGVHQVEFNAITTSLFVVILAVLSPYVLIAILALFAVTRYRDRQGLLCVVRATSIELLIADDDIPRGPYRNSYEWMHASTTATLTAVRRIPDPDEDDIKRVSFLEELLKTLSYIFPPDAIESTWLAAHDLHDKNIMVNDDGELVAILDWEFCMTVPAWAACQLPKLFREQVILYSKPVLDGYDPEYEELYWSDLATWEQSRTYKDLFLSEMERLEPDWISTHRETEIQRHVMQLLSHSLIGMTGDDDDFDWLDKVRKGEPYDELFLGALQF